MSERPTPETNAAEWSWYDDDCTPENEMIVPADLARKLERERDEARGALRAVLELANDIPDESLDDWKIEFHKVLEKTK